MTTIRPAYTFLKIVVERKAKRCKIVPGARE